MSVFHIISRYLAKYFYSRNILRCCALLIRKSLEQFWDVMIWFQRVQHNTVVGSHPPNPYPLYYSTETHSWGGCRYGQELFAFIGICPQTLYIIFKYPVHDDENTNNIFVCHLTLTLVSTRIPCIQSYDIRCLIWPLAFSSETIRKELQWRGVSYQIDAHKNLY